MNERGPRTPQEDGDWVDRFLLPFVRDSTLWPVLLVVIGHAVAFMAPVLLWTARERNRLGMVAFVALLALTAATVRFEIRRQGRPGALTGLWASTWILSAVVAALADHYGVF